MTIKNLNRSSEVECICQKKKEKKKMIVAVIVAAVADVVKQ